MGGMGDELKVYIPRMVQPVLRLFLQDQSDMKIITQKVTVTYSVYVHVHACLISYEMTKVDSS